MAQHDPELASAFTNVFSISGGGVAACLRTADAEQFTFFVHATRSIRDVDNDGAPRSLSETYICDIRSFRKIATSPLAAVAVHDVSPSGLRTFCATNGKEKASTLSVYGAVELGEPNLVADGSELHGPVMGDPWFSGVSWSPDERFVAYVAHEKAPKKGSHFDKAALKEDDPPPTKYDYEEEWGEKVPPHRTSRTNA